MIKLFFITFIIAELIIALAVILKIHRLNKCVNSLNAIVLANKAKIKAGLMDFRFLIEEFSTNFNAAKELIRQRKEDYMIKAAKNLLIYLSIIFLRGKYKKSILAYQLISEVYECFSEFDD